MFEWYDLDTEEPTEKFETRFVELYNITLGACAVIDSNKFPIRGTGEPEKGLLVVTARRAGAPNANGLGRDLICMTYDGREVIINDFENKLDEVVYIRNNPYAMPDLTIGESGNTIAEIKKSLRHNVINSRLTPIVVAHDAKAKSAIETALKENASGTYAVVMSDNILTDGQEFVLKVTDVKDQDKIQYLNHAYDDELRHWYNLHGLDITGASKQAQQTTDEVNSGANSRKILPYLMLREREKAAKRLNDVYGLNIGVRFSEPWRLEFGLELTPREAVEESVEAPTEEAVEVANNDMDDDTKTEGGEQNENI